MIAATRLEQVPVETAAAWWGIAPQLASQWRQKAEQRLVAAIHAGETSGVVLDARLTQDREAQARRNGVAALPPRRRPGTHPMPGGRRLHQRPAAAKGRI